MHRLVLRLVRIVCFNRLDILQKNDAIVRGSGGLVYDYLCGGDLKGVVEKVILWRVMFQCPRHRQSSLQIRPSSLFRHG